ncbi:unnamed protein product [Lactuca saligna]|uniref:Arabidopsis retrotransposon Orf1 C-terminal domain-containing protein n=1 Tax=Lactuca saligna TaxID=75948 RepID=A0AA35V4U8_LACSI|nr:unnamed protein product [Lactuca saligna]
MGTGATSSKGGSKGKSKDPPFRLLNREDRKTYDFLVSNKRQVKSTKFLHRESFASLGVLDGVQALFNNIGWGQFLHNRAATYVEPTLEFLTTFNPEEEAQTVTFQILGEKRSLPHRVVNALMGAPVDNLYYQQDPWPRNFNEHYFWQQITNEPQYSSSSLKASSIIHPCLCLAHRVLTCTIFARSEVGQISKAELFFLWCMTRENGPRPDFASFFFTKCYNLTTMDKGDIFIGGLITLIASRPPLQLHLSTLPFEKASGPSSLDGNALRRMQLIRDSVVGPMWILDNQPYLILPHEYIGSFEPTDPDQWIIPSDYPPPVDDEDDQFQPAQQFAEPQFQPAQHTNSTLYPPLLKLIKHHPRTHKHHHHNLPVVLGVVSPGTTQLYPLLPWITDQQSPPPYFGGFHHHPLPSLLLVELIGNEATKVIGAAPATTSSLL